MIALLSFIVKYYQKVSRISEKTPKTFQNSSGINKILHDKRVSRTKIQQPIANVNHPNAFFNLMPGILRESTLPKCTPTMAMAVIVSKNDQSIGRVSKSPKKPVSELSAIIKSEVPVAVFIGKPVSRTNAGMMRKPPPAPTKPVSSPIKVPSKMMSNVLYFFREG